jgi:hypothetical protein
MIRRQRRAHLWIWRGFAVFLPLALAVILSLAASQVIERAPVQLEPPATPPAPKGTVG